MAKAPDLVMRVEADPEKMEDLETAIKDFKDAALRVENAIVNVRHAIQALEFRANVVPKVE